MIIFIPILFVAVIAYVFTNVLIMPGHVFSWYGRWLNRMSMRHPNKNWLWKPMGLCGICFCGQLAFWWYFLFTNVRDYRPDTHIAVICGAIYTLILLEKHT